MHGMENFAMINLVWFRRLQLT